MIDFNTDNTDNHLAACVRFENIAREPDAFGSRQSRMMDLAAADGHNGNAAIDWARLLAADDFNFVHDVAGIHNHIDRRTGRIESGFLPRFARVSTADEELHR